MTENLTHILIFKTNINTEADKFRIGQLLSAASDSIEEWSVDTDDVDRVLRIVSHHLSPEIIVEKLNTYGYQCQELE